LAFPAVKRVLLLTVCGTFHPEYITDNNSFWETNVTECVFVKESLIVTYVRHATEVAVDSHHANSYNRDENEDSLQLSDKCKVT
jgi:hypothetical protein